MTLNFRPQLPLRFARTFRPWSYQLGHGRLELRSGHDPGSADTLYIVFLNVVGMQVRAWYKEILITEAMDTDAIDRFVDIPERQSHRYMRLSVGDGVHEGFVVCGGFDTRVEPLSKPGAAPEISS
ncbi:hypothetical protein DMB66_42390 [Actinoplanes sp. ATCC 53533]|uniref:hypothetical protein n=1 Tax=Actinoplanes sp. ATCC 53533 TaxID=1288362 RepID=UPI000F796EB7|nr:hypothetical protein [Actinoplanes sp. ATCC 53533]RSM51277.1 hypothetical protein DMB66_42390 [Actinoplanes sp. ATCC 53533]